MLEMDHCSDGPSWMPPQPKLKLRAGYGGIESICVDNPVGAVFSGYGMKRECVDRPGIDKTGNSTGSNAGVALDSCLEYTGSAGKVMNFIADTGLDNTGSDDTAMEFTDGNNDCAGVAMDCIDGNSVWLHMLSCFEPDRCQDPLCHAGKAVLGHRLCCQVRAGIPCFDLILRESPVYRVDCSLYGTLCAHCPVLLVCHHASLSPLRICPVRGLTFAASLSHTGLGVFAVWTYLQPV